MQKVIIFQVKKCIERKGKELDPSFVMYHCGLKVASLSSFFTFIHSKKRILLFDCIYKKAHQRLFCSNSAY